MTFLGLRSPRLIRLILFIAVIAASVSIANVVYRAYADGGFNNSVWGLDLSQWYRAGKRLSEGRNPYSQVVPSAAPVLLLLWPITFLDWAPATLIWAVTNLVLSVICVWLMLKLCGYGFVQIQGMLCLFLFLSLIATRQTIELGQISLLIAALTLGAIILIDKKPWLSGVLLGIAISKYTLSFPLLLYLIWQRRYKSLLACILTQLISLCIVALIARTSPLQIAQDYFRYSQTILAQTETYSIHLLSLNWGYIGYVALAAFSLATACILLFWHHQSSSLHVDLRQNDLTRLTLIGILTMWSMYGLYHGRQDMILAFLFVVVAALSTSGNNPTQSAYEMTAKESLILNSFVWMVLAVWILPLYVLLGYPAYRSLYALVNVGVSFVWLWLLFRVRCVQTSGSQLGRRRV